MTQEAEILPSDTPERYRAAVGRACSLLKAGELVALPTETVYGLAANAFNPDAVARIFAAKMRPESNPIIVHVASLAMARRCASTWPAVADKLAEAFWPGPLTMILPRANDLPVIVTAGGPTVGIRWPSHPLMQDVILACGFPLAAPSANASNELSPTNAAHVKKSLGSRIGWIVDGGECSVGIESTVVDLYASPLLVLRPGMIHIESLRAVIGEVAEGPGESAPVLRSPGQLRKHYSPKARLHVLNWDNEFEFRKIAALTGVDPATCHVLAHTIVPGSAGFAGVSVLPHEPHAFARALYAELHRIDDLKAETIIVEAAPNQPAWRGIADRLTRAAAE